MTKRNLGGHDRHAGRRSATERLGPGQAGDLLTAVRAGGPAGVRNEPMVALMRRLALRAGEVARLLLEDIDWRSGVLSVRGKGDRLDQMPLPADVGGPLARYLHCGRPGHDAPAGVLALDAPRGPLTAPRCGKRRHPRLGRRRHPRPGHRAPTPAHRSVRGARRRRRARRGRASAGHTSPQAIAVYARSDIAARRAIAKGGAGTMDDVTWRKSSYSAENGGQCVEVARNLPHSVVVRDSKNPDGTMLVFAPADWQAFVSRVKAGRHDPT